MATRRIFPALPQVLLLGRLCPDPVSSHISWSQWQWMPVLVAIIRLPRKVAMVTEVEQTELGTQHGMLCLCRLNNEFSLYTIVYRKFRNHSHCGFFVPPISINNLPCWRHHEHELRLMMKSFITNSLYMEIINRHISTLQPSNYFILYRELVKKWGMKCIFMVYNSIWDFQNNNFVSSLTRCSCGNCVPMDVEDECMSCNEMEKVMARILEWREVNDPDTLCVTQHEGFGANCLNIWVLQNAYFAYRQAHGNYPANSLHRYVNLLPYLYAPIVPLSLIFMNHDHLGHQDNSD